MNIKEQIEALNNQLIAVEENTAVQREEITYLKTLQKRLERILSFTLQDGNVIRGTEIINTQINTQINACEKDIKIYMASIGDDLIKARKLRKAIETLNDLVDDRAEQPAI